MSTETLAPQAGLPRINEPAPDFEAKTTHGVKKLADYKGKWLVLFSHPADFTPVCTTEFTAFAKHYEDFKKLNCELLGLSIDSIYSHLAWVRNIKEKFGIEIQFPIIEDLSMKVAKAYGMIHPGAGDTSAVRATFIIDDQGILRQVLGQLEIAEAPRQPGDDPGRFDPPDRLDCALNVRFRGVVHFSKIVGRDSFPPPC